MKRELILLLTLVLLILTVVAERASAVYARNLSAQQTKMSKKLEDLTVRTEGADVERQEYGDVIAMAEELENRISMRAVVIASAQTHMSGKAWVDNFIKAASRYR